MNASVDIIKLHQVFIVLVETDRLIIDFKFLFDQLRKADLCSELYRKTIIRYGIWQSANDAGGRCHDNARCESMWARLKEELLYGRYE